MAILSKSLSPTDAKRRCTVPMKDFKKKGFPKLAGKQKVDFKVEDESGYVWSFCCYTRMEKDPNHPKHPKPVLIGEWIPFAKSKNLSEGDRVIIYEEQDEKGFMRYKIKVEKQTRPSKTRNNKGSLSSHNSDDQSTATFQPAVDLFPGVLNHDLGKTTTTTSSSIDEGKIPATHSTSQDKECHKGERPSLSSSLELTLKPTMTMGTTAATSSSTHEEHMINPRSTSQGMASHNKMPTLNRSLELTLKTTLTESQQHDYTQDTIPKTLNLLASFS